MPLRLSFWGGVGEVTGSRHLLEVDGARLLMDCGLFQGHRQETLRKNRQAPFPYAQVSAAALSHAHMDHSGNLPSLTKGGYAGPIHCTVPTVELTRIMLLDSAHLQLEDALFFNKLHAKNGQRIEPLYTADDVEACLARFKPHPYGEPVAVSEGLEVRFFDAGHVLGSAMIQADVKTPKGRRRVFFTGDLGRAHTLLMNAPKPPQGVDYLLIESTYGDRVHDPVSGVEGQFTEIINRAVAQKGKILIPSFALERTQEIVFVLEKLLREKKVPPIPLYVDSPMAVSITELFNRYKDGFCFDPEFQAYAAKDRDPFGFQSVRYVKSTEDSKKINDLKGPFIILSASGMCEGGRILHHLRNNIEDPSTTVLLVGYQSEGTLGRRLQDGAKTVRIFGLEHAVRAAVKTLHAFSAHADRNDLFAFISAMQPRPRRIFLVHGDPDQRAAMAQHLRSQGFSGIEVPEYGQAFDLD